MIRPIAAHRHDEILKRLGASGTVSVEELADHFNVSRETVRRDLKLLAGRGRLAVVHGGATRKTVEATLASRLSENPDGKAAIGQAAASLVEDGMVVLLDSGATTLAVAEALQHRPDLTVVTPSLPIALLMCREPGRRVHILGGEVDCTDEAAFGIEVLEALNRYRFDLAFVGIGGISEQGEVTDFTRVGAEQRGRMLTAAARSYLIADRTKFGRLTPIRMPHAGRATGLITDRAPPPAVAEAFQGRGTAITVAG